MENTAVIPDVEIKETHILLQNMLEAQESGDIELFASCFVHDNKAVNIGTDVDEFWIGWKPFFNYMKKMIQLRKGMKITAKNTNISIESKCGLAWYSQLIDTCLETKGEPFRIEGFRHTGVMKRIDNHWKIVQSHMSIAFEPEET
ncbi:nuclear transport factor 2 family protein [Plebeiibacterium marinum]|uniref:Nuclear transport factor 2 family protein n=1 Tax=Plebeiibacterium marinum TaxID=2992111 RepID=A0AAE3MC24_9BACT|nr:nuclear transport factor 2 family protein [Plebeiobacterium marinum]MCW3804829.1 nuclear transport factor 2 family protein [Plebeiobacterium marinum]